MNVRQKKSGIIDLQWTKKQQLQSHCAVVMSLLVIIELASTLKLYASTADSSSNLSFRPCLHVEIGGAAQLISLHAEGYIEGAFDDSEMIALGASVGIGIGFVTPSFCPIMLRSLYGEEDYFEIGVGTLVQYKEQPDKENWYEWSDELFNFGFLVGYRYQPTDRGLLFRICAWGIMDTGTGKLLPTLGGSIGYAF